MNEDPDREEEILQDALRIPAGPERDAYLDEACGGDEKMRREIEELLAAASKPASAIRRVGDLAALMDTYNILQIARELPEADRAAYLEEVSHDAEQREHLERMLADDWFRGVGEDEDDAVAIAEGPGSVIGAYKLLEKIGEGAFGVVFMAEQRGELPRRVALKILKEGMDTREVIARFEAERRALALMEHSHIAKVFDAGATETGRPYFVMELVRGVPITQFCDAKKHTIRQRLALFMAVCDAVTHAHQKGIIHRDLKPSNILVGLDGDKPVPKVIDFGIAKATQQRLTEKTYFTSFKQVIGTFPYLCPEQSDLSALDIDTRADIYALGVVLYELLAGKLPFDLKTIVKAGFEAMRRVVRDEEPPKPSTQMATLQGDERRTVETSHGAEMDKLQSLIRGDLDRIVMKAMEKDRDRRYETANALRRDVERYLNDEPVEAAAPSSLYLLLKFSRRNKGALAVVAAIVISLFAGFGLSTLMWLSRELDERQRQIELWVDRFEHLWGDGSEFETYVEIGAEDRAMLLGKQVVPLANPRDLTFAVYTHKRPTKMMDRFIHLVDHLERGLSEKLNDPIRINFRIYKGYVNALSDLLDNDVDFMHMGPNPYLQARKADPGVRLLAVHDDDNVGVIFARFDSGIHTLEDLRNKKVAFGDKLSTLSSVVPRAELWQAGLHSEILAPGSDYLNSHDEVFHSVIGGKFDAGAARRKVVLDETKELGPKAKLVVELHRFTAPSQGWVAASGVAAAIAEEFKRRLIDMDRDIVQHYDEDLRGYIDVTDEYFEALEALEADNEAAKKFGELPRLP